MLPDEGQHAAAVDAWLARTADGRSPAQLIALLERALGAILRRAGTTLGEVTLMAVLDRVLFGATTRHPALPEVTVERTGVRFGDPAGRASASQGELRAALRAVLVELLTVIGNLTAELLTPALHGALQKVDADPASPREGRSP